MSLYLGTTEITKLRDLALQPGLDITDLWFGETNVYTAWQTYEGTLPATFNANGDDMRQYQIYGNTGGVGDRTVQLFDKTATDTNNGYIVGAYLNRDGTVVSDNTINVSEYIPVSGNTDYILRYGRVTGYYNVPSVCFYDISKDFISGLSYSNKNPKSFTTPASAAYVRISFRKVEANIVALAKGSTIPEPLPPFGYGVDISTSDGTDTTTTPIYIGNDPLEKVRNYSDYVDYELQKVVRVIKKYVLTGKEDWEEITGAYASRKYFRLVFAPINYCIRHACVSSHLTQETITTSTTTAGFDVFDSSSVGGEVLAIRPANVQSTTFADFKAWLVEQYFAGTPVTIWCALTAAEETDPPVTLPALPTAEGETIVDYAGSGTAPEKVLLKYRKEGF